MSIKTKTLATIFITVLSMVSILYLFMTDTLEKTKYEDSIRGNKTVIKLLSDMAVDSVYALDIEKLSYILNSINSNEVLAVNIVDTEGNILAQKGHYGVIFEKCKYFDTVQKNGKNGITLLKESEKFIYYAPIKTTADDIIGYVVMETDRRYLDENIKSSATPYLVILLLFGVVTMLLASVIAYLFTEPLLNIVEKLKGYKLGSGIKLSINRKDELGFLAKEIENMDRKISADLKTIQEKDRALFEQSKLMALRNMLNNIAHQWRQPLNIIALNIQHCSALYAEGMMDSKTMEQITKKSMEHLEYMSKTIDDFKSFFSHNEEISEIAAENIFAELKNSLDLALQKSDIVLGFEGENVRFKGYRNELIKSISNIVYNAKEAIEKNGRQGRINIKTAREGDRVAISIKDNGGGISKDIMSSIFEPYFTTKFKSKGTGTGLYMSKIIIEYNMGGELTVKSSGDETEFTIKIPLRIDGD